MRIDRAAKFGVIGAVGVATVSLVTLWLMQSARADAIRPGDATPTVLIVGIAGTAAALIYLFAVIGAFVDRKLEARELDSPGE